MKVLKPLKLSLMTRCFEHHRRYFLGVGIIAMHRFSHALVSEVDLWKFLAENLGGEAVPDAGMPKSKAEYLVSGSAFQPGGVAGPECDVRVQFGDLRKHISVVGNRYWKRNITTEPEPFVDMPISWANAFGGPNFKRNPLGKGDSPIETEDGSVHPLPNIETAGQRVRLQGDQPDPIGFGPIDLMWPQRFNKVGTHDKKWLVERFPGFADDMNWSIFNIAPEDQQSDEPLVGDEEFLIEGMHPRKQFVDGKLPGMATRCFVNQKTDEGEVLREIAMKLTTVWLFPDKERFLQIYHGTYEIQESDAADILQILIAAEEAAKPKSVEHYESVRQKRIDPKHGALHSLKDADLLPEKPEFNSEQDQAMAQMEKLLATEGLRRKHANNKRDRQIAESREYLVGLGLDPDEYGAATPPPDEPPPKLEEIAELIEQQEVEVAEQKEAAEASRVAQKQEAIELLEAEGLDPELASLAEKPIIGPPKFTAERERERLAAIKADCEESGTEVKLIDEYLEDPERNQLLEDGEKGMRDNYQQTAHHQGVPQRFTGEVGAESKSAVVATLSATGNLSRQNLTGFDLSDLDLAGIDLSGAWLENANLNGTNLEGANLADAVLARADLTDANLNEANLTKSNLSLATFTNTSADGANFEEAIIEKAVFDGASLCRAQMKSVRMSEATFANTDMTNASLPMVTFLKTDLRGICFAGADLNQCNIIECDVSGVDFTGATLNKTNFLTANCESAVFFQADMTQARFVQSCVMDQVDFREAIMNSVNLRQTSLKGSNLTDVKLAGADLSEANLTGAKLDRVFARGSLFIKTCFESASLTQADFMQSILMNADLRSANLSEANFFAADLAGIHKNDATKFDGANLNKTRTLPLRDEA